MRLTILERLAGACGPAVAWIPGVIVMSPGLASKVNSQRTPARSMFGSTSLAGANVFSP